MNDRQHSSINCKKAVLFETKANNEKQCLNRGLTEQNYVRWQSRLTAESNRNERVQIPQFPLPGEHAHEENGSNVHLILFRAKRIGSDHSAPIKNL